MIKKILFIIVFLSFVISCGKKGDPEYKESTIEKNMQLISINKA